MGSFTRLPVRGRWALFVALAAACSNRILPPLPDAAALGPVSIEASSDTLAVPPFASRQLVFHVLGPQGEAVPGVVMHFSILDDADTPGSGGAQLSFASAITDGDGMVTLQVIAGQGASGQQPLTFTVQASAGDALLDIPIFVTTGALASVEIMPVFPDLSSIDNPVIATNIYFYDGTSCVSVSPAHPAFPMRQVRTLSRTDPPATFTSVVTNGVHAVLGVAVDAQDNVVARGCTDVLGASLSAEQPMLILLPLPRLYPSPQGTFQAVSGFSFTTPLPGTASARNTWTDLSNDACDPARLWLDCTIDALSAPSADNPLDCQPVPGAGGPLGALLTARRAMAGGSSTCANQLDGAGNPSLDAEVYGLFPSGSLDALHLDTLPDELGSALTSLTVHSTLTVTPLATANVFNIDHVLTGIDLPNAAVHPLMTMTDLAAPCPEAAFVSGVSRAGQLVISSHGFTLGLGSAARFTFAASSLAPRLGVQATDVSAFVEALVNLATSIDGGTISQGCDALDSLLCADVEQAPGCVRAACLLGVNTLIQRMDASFAALDGQNLDFLLSGSAPIVDLDGDGSADALGSSSSSTLVGPGLWSGTFKSKTVTTNVYGSWTAERVSAPSR
jgi:hypothetical protein